MNDDNNAHAYMEFTSIRRQASIEPQQVFSGAKLEVNQNLQNSTPGYPCGESKATKGHLSGGDNTQDTSVRGGSDISDERRASMNVDNVIIRIIDLNRTYSTCA